MSTMTLYGYWRSSATYRVRIALNLKQLAYQQRSVHLVKDGGEQHSRDFHALNPNELVPVLTDGDLHLTQSLAIMTYLDDRYPQPRLVPEAGPAKYQVLALTQDIAIDIHPLNNLRVLQYLAQNLSASEGQKKEWYQHWIEVGFAALEEKLHLSAGQYCVNDTLSLADVCLVPQVYNAERFDVPMAQFPTISRITQSLRAMDAFTSAAPENQPDAQL